MNTNTSQPPAASIAMLLRTNSCADAEKRFSEQERRIRDCFAGRYDLSQVRIYRIVGEGIKPDHPDFQQTLQDAGQGGIKVLLMSDPGQLFRSDGDTLRAIDELKTVGVDVCFSTYPDVDPTLADGRIFVSLAFSMARLESMNMSERVKAALKAKILRGEYIGKAPDGYRRVESAGGHTLEIDAESAPVLRMIFQLALQDSVLSTTQICDEMHELDYTLPGDSPFVTVTPSGRKRRATQWVRRVLTNPTYAGLQTSKTHNITWEHRMAGDWEPIIPLLMFEEVQQRLDSRRLNQG